jgi:CRP/FNR family cyclic AMP-dependent transcriptional regulator
MIIPRTRRSTRSSPIERIPIFSSCPPRELEKLERMGTRLRVCAGCTLITAGEIAFEMSFVLAGTASCHVGSREVATFGTGDFFGEVAILSGGPRTATVVATSAMDLWVLNRGEFGQVLQTSPEIARRMLGVMARRLRAADLAA